MQVLASQLHFLANKNAELAIPPLFWPVNCIKIGGHVALLSDPTVYSLYCVTNRGKNYELLLVVENRMQQCCWGNTTLFLVINNIFDNIEQY